MKRVKINSRTPTVHVNLNYPTIDPNRSYVLTVEKLLVPALDSLVVNKPLFTVERRLEGAINHDDITARLLPLNEKYTTFTPQNVRTVSQLLFQMNIFLQELCLRCVSEGLVYDDEVHQYEVPDSFDTQAGDWNNLEDADQIKQALMAVIRPDGKIGLAFSNDGARLFAVRLTDLGKTLFGRTNRYVAVDGDHNFIEEYDVQLNLVLVPPELDVTNVQLPDPVEDGGYICFFDPSMFSHIQYRHELVVQSSLPLNNTVECDTTHSFYKRQLASYRFPDSNVQMEYDNAPINQEYNGRYLCEKFQSMYTFEENLATHNKFILKGTELQNFHLYLVTRNYEKQADKTYKQVDEPYDMHNQTFFTIQLAVKPLNV